MIIEQEFLIVWSLVFTRIVCAISVIPMMAEKSVPVIVKAGLSGVLATVVAVTLGDAGIDVNTIEYAAALVKEVALGLILGFGVSMLFEVYNFVGQIISVQSSLSMAMVMDPVSGSQVMILGKFFVLGFTTIFIMSGGFHWFLMELIGSFYQVPLGGASFDASLIGVMIEGITVFFVVSFKIAGPIFGVLLVVDCAMGILAKAVPQMNMFVVGIPIKLLLVFGLLILFWSGMSYGNQMLIEEIKTLFSQFLEGVNW